jgi:exo-beta-1,3-glucanase (GH17 family)
MRVMNIIYQSLENRLLYLITIIGYISLSFFTNSWPKDLSLTNQKQIYGLCYSPFRDGDNPNLGVSPSEAEVREDLSILSVLISKIRTYGNDNILFEIPRLCYEKGINIYVGAWIYWDKLVNDQNVLRLIQVADQGYETTLGLIVGSEVLLRGDLSEAELIEYLTTVKEASEIPVSTAETYWNYLNHPGIAEKVDFILIHIHPYWDGISIEAAAQYVIDRYNEVKQAYPDKEVIIGETGWPTVGDIIDEALPGEENQKKFLEEFTQLASESNVKYFIFEAFDEKWKTQDEGIVGGSWGLYYANRSPKPALDEYLKDNNNGSVSSIQTDGEDGGCFIATAVYGSYFDPHVRILRAFRDKYLLKNHIGKVFVKLYYWLSPTIAKFIEKNCILKLAIRFALTPIVYGIIYPEAAFLFFSLLIVIVTFGLNRKR